MKIEVSGKNEFEFIPEIADNEKAPRDIQWRIIVKRMNYIVEGNRFSFKKEDGGYDYDNYKLIEKSIIRHENPPTLINAVQKDKNGNPVEEILTTEILLGNVYPELYKVVSELYFFLIKLLTDNKTLETKKS